MARVNGRYSSSTVFHLPQPTATRPLIPVDCHFWSLSQLYQLIVRFFCDMAHGFLPSSQVALVYFVFLDYCYRQNQERWHEQSWELSASSLWKIKKHWLLLLPAKTLPSSHLQWNGEWWMQQVTAIPTASAMAAASDGCSDGFRDGCSDSFSNGISNSCSEWRHQRRL